VLTHPAQALIFVLLIVSPVAARAEAPAASAEDVIFVADGAGNFQYASKMLRTLVHQTGAPLTVETFVWSHGNKRIVSDLMDVRYARTQGQHLADTVLAYHQQHPHARIHLVGHSAGSMVVLSAVEHLPAGTIDNIVLLAPAVSSEYDLRPALRGIRGSVEVHFSSHDWLHLGLCTTLMGCADRLHCGASGRKGFVLRIESPEDADLLERLHQHCWEPDDRRLGNNGGHYGAYQPEYLKARVLPILVDNR
jgi:pimeloyl-ACP methyl ester carboxylesterase